MFVSLGFNLDSIEEPTYIYTNGNRELSQEKLRKDLIKKGKYDNTLSLDKSTKENGFYQLYDCGKYKYLSDKSRYII